MHKWPKIESFSNVQRNVQKCPLIALGDSTTYRSKVKLDGTNAGIHLRKDGSVVAQSRTRKITPSDDNHGFAVWVENHKSDWRAVSTPQEDIVVFGEWCGPGIQRGSAVNLMEKKVFAVFGLLAPDRGPGQNFVDSPVVLSAMMSGMPDTYVLPWYGNSQPKEFHIRWRADNSKELSRIDDLVEQVAKLDPWVLDVFGLRGPGEGLVLYPRRDPVDDLDSLGFFENLAFKVKSPNRSLLHIAKPRRDTTCTVAEFVPIVLTEERLQQALSEVCRGTPSSELIPDFLRWLANDIRQEAQEEMKERGLDPKNVIRACTAAAVSWYKTLQGSRVE